MSQVLSQDEQILFLEEYKSILSQITSDVNYLHDNDENPEILQKLYVAANSLLGIAEFSSYQEMREISKAFAALTYKLSTNELEYKTEHLYMIKKILYLLSTIYQDIESGRQGTIIDTSVLSVLKEFIGERDAGFFAEEIDEEEAEVFRNELSGLVESYSNATDLIVNGDRRTETLFQCFKAAHTLKGFGGMIGSVSMEKVSKELEKVFSLAKDSKLEISEEVIRISKKGQDFYVNLVDAILDGEEIEYPIDDILEDTASLLEKTSESEQPKAQEKLSEEVLAVQGEELSVARSLLEEGYKLFDIVIIYPAEVEMKTVRSYQIINALKESGVIVFCYPSEELVASLAADSNGIKIIYAVKQGDRDQVVRLIKEIIDIPSLIVSRKEV